MQFLMTIIRHFGNSNSSTWIRALVIFVIVWGILVYVFATKLNTPLGVEQGKTLSRVNEALKQLEKSSQKNEELKKIIDNYLNDLDNSQQNPSQKKFIENLEYQLEHVANVFVDKNDHNSHNTDGIQPLFEYEQLRRRVRQNTQEMWNYFSSELGKIRKNSGITSDISEQIRNVLELSAEHKRSLISDIDQMRSVDGYDMWRHQEAEDLSELVQRRLSYIQNPLDCKNARKLLCHLNKGCGYGCQLHHVVYCFIVAYATERTMILKSKGWRYHKAGWEEVFQPVSDTCTHYDVNLAKNWPGTPDTKVLILPIVDSLIPRPSYLPLAIPEDLAPRLMKLHGDPTVWWISQFLKYLLKPKHETQEMLEIGMEKLGWKKPIVGVHIRRTDKVGTEAAFHSIEEYMTYVEDYYLTLEMNNSQKIDRRVFLASDDPRVITEARTKYPQYKIIGDPNIAKTADVSTRYTDSSLNGIILDIHMLSLSDYLVCTFSSQVCRTAYEIMQSFYPDAAERFKSLDDIYYYGGQNAHNRETILSHKPRNKDEIYMKPGDLIGIAGNHWDGFSKGKNTRTNQVGLFPSFKVKDKIETVSLPTYSNADRFDN